MEVQTKEIDYYETEGGTCPFRDWLLSLRDKEGRRKIRVRIDRVALGNIGYCESVGEGVSELKIDFGPGYRVYFAMAGNRLVLLLTGGDKSSQKRDIKTAHEYWAEYRRRYDRN